MGNSGTVGAEQQHLRALEYANRVRLARARMKRKIAAGELSAADVVLTCPWQAHSMSVSDLLMSQKRWGLTRCRRLLVSLGVPENKAIGTLTERQRLALAAVLTAKGTAAVTRVLIDSTDGETTWSTIGVSENIIEASWQALSDSIVYGLLHLEKSRPAVDDVEKEEDG